MNAPKISVIMPIYNVEDYLEETLNSILNQTFFENLEILMIDDGSTDDSRYIIEKYALDYDNFHAFHKENEGSGIARNFGMEHAQGEYICFLDPDDLIACDGYEKLYNLAIKNDSDIVTSNFTKFGRYNSWKDILSKKSFGDLDSVVDCITLREMHSLIWDTTSWNKLFKKDFLDANNILFPNKNIVYQDIPFTLRAYILADKISIYPEIFYYWRIRRSSNLSRTQQIAKMKNFNDRIESISICMDVLKNEHVSDSLKNDLYKKFLNHDLFLFLKRYHLYPDDSTEPLLKKINNLLNIMPTEIKEDLNSFKKIIYKMVENNDINGLNYFSSLNYDLMENPHIPPELDEIYVKYIDFDNDALSEDLIVKKQELADYDENNIYLEFTESINYLSDNHIHKTKATFVDSNNNEHPLDINGNVIILPVNLIKDKCRSNIKMGYIDDNFKKESYLQNSKRQVIRYSGFDIEIGTESNRIFCIDKRLTNENEIKINSITFEDGILNFEGTSCEEINQIFLENVVTFERYYYPVISNNNDNEFNIQFSIPHKDILQCPVDKWEIRADKTFNSMKIPRKFEFYTSFNKIRILNARNKILIENDLYNKFQKLSEYFDEINDLKNIIKELNKENKQLNKKNIRLENRNNDLNNIIEAYKSRFVVRMADKSKNLVKK